MTSKPCQHLFRFWSYRGEGPGGRTIKLPDGSSVKSVGLHLGFRCQRCGESVERKATPGERKFHKEHVAHGRNGMHAVWHAFCRKFKNKGERGYRIIGWELMEGVEKWAVKYPHDVRLASIDDSHFSSSTLVLVEHRSAKEYMGTTVVVIPQCSGEPPLEFFMYPDHRQTLIDALLSIRKAAKVVEAKQRVNERREAKLIKKYLRHTAVL